MLHLRTEPIVAHTDSRGALYKLHPETVHGEVYAVRAGPNQSRGHHLHREMGEWFTAVVGVGVVVAVDPATGESAEASLVGQRVYVPAGIAHAIFNTGPEDLLVLAFAEAAHQPSDVIAFPVSRT
ncbi:MAG: cupin domain-containing protein [Myxococcota bacterium]|nr:cupin domain-containing protein [Myxococcota bacterium]